MTYTFWPESSLETPNPRMIVFAVVFIALVVIVHRYLWMRLIRDTRLAGAWRKALGWTLGGLAVLLLTGAFTGRMFSRDVAVWLYVPAYLWFGFLGTVLPFLLLIDIPRWLLKLGRRLMRRSRSSAPEESGSGGTEQESSPTVPERREFMQRFVYGAVGVGGVGLVGAGAANALGEVEVNRFSVNLERLPRALDGLKVVQLTDVHIGPLLDGRFLNGVVEKVNAERPDLVVITGDLVDGSPRQIGEDVARLRDIQSRYGTYFVTGNHEYYSGAERWLEFLHGLGIESLENRRVTIGDAGPGGATFDLAGITDKTASRFIPGHRQDMAAALEGRDPDRELILLAHRPNPIQQASELGVGLQLSGHTHGGQFFPITLFGPLVHPYNQGLHRHGDTQIYVSPGTGFWGPPIRTMTSSEVTSITLVSG